MGSSRRIFISREHQADASLYRFCLDQHIELVSLPCIEMKVIPGIDFPKTDWVFFSSPSGVQLYLDHYELKADKVAALGQGTKKLLEQYDHRVDYVGPTDNRPSQTGLDFAARIQAEELVLFPLSALSRKSVSKQFPDKNKVEIPFYETTIIDQDISGEFEIAILTSPSNVDGFMKSNAASLNCRILCLGETTEDHIHSHYPTSKEVINVGTSEENWIKKIQAIIPLRS